jgi:aminopeptidase N
MSVKRASGRRLAALAVVALLASVAAQAQERPRLQVESYVVDAELHPQASRLSGRARVTFTALDDISIASFELHNGLRPTRVLDAKGRELNAERVSQDFSVRVSLPEGLANGETTTLTFEYEGVLRSADDSPVYGLNLARITAQGAYLLYAGRWFPTVGYNTSRFAATMNITVPQDWTVAGSSERPARKETAGRGRVTHSFTWGTPSFPGTILAGPLTETAHQISGVEVRTYLRAENQQHSAGLAETAARQYVFFSSLYGPAAAASLSVAELPDDTVPAAWAPGLVALNARAIADPGNYRLLANMVSRQWWGVQVSPATRDDFWIAEGFGRFSEARYVEHAAGPAAYEDAAKDMAVGAMAYDTIPLSSAGRLDVFSPEFQSMVTDKGAMILHMLRWVLGDERFDATLRDFAAAYAGKPASVEDFRRVAEQHYGEQLLWFFSQWLDSTGAPEFRNRYTVFRTPKGFRVVGEIAQDLDLFRMPMELKVDTDGESEMKVIEVVGTQSPYVIETFGRPRVINIDPNNRVLKNSAELRVRASILRGQQMVMQGSLAEALREFQRALDDNKYSSLAHYRVAEVFFLQRNYQAAANAYREALNGDAEPRWTIVWSHIQLGKIFDLTGQRERATNEYRQALQTNDNTQGALDEARRYLAEPYQRERGREMGALR